jgi:hypothetical protein
MCGGKYQNRRNSPSGDQQIAMKLKQYQKNTKWEEVN